jgi:hypothetical protein
MIRVTIALALLTVFASPALASGHRGTCTTAPEDKWMTKADIEAKVAKAGYEVDKNRPITRTSGNCFQVYANDKAGLGWELFIDPTNANIVYSVVD